MVNIVLIVFLITLIITPLAYQLLKRAGFRVENYRQKTVVKSFGILFVLLAAIAWLTNGIIKTNNARIGVLFAAALVLGLTGLADDIWGNPEYKGLRGHLKALASKRLTTGLLKAVVGVLFGLVISLILRGPFYLIMLSTLTFALTVNLFNSLDLRPGRALKVFLLLMLGFAVFSKNSSETALVLIAMALPLAYFDLREKALLGDAGSNILGGFSGYMIIQTKDLTMIVPALFILIFLHVVSESNSFTTIIENNPLLRWFDNLGRLK